MLCAVLITAHPTTPHDVIRLSSQSSDPELLGRILSWPSTLLYLGSRLPQIYKNHRRRSTAGLSPTLFIAAFFGNLFCSPSLLTNPLAWDSYPPYGSHGWVGGDGSERWEWIGRAASFWLGAVGMLALDAAVGAQFLMFGEGKGKEEAVVGWRGGGGGGGG
ncbi:PQ-loop repeat [Lasallia pustulata]|uniref:PQ-loop repeat n=1 Tax=Lasallia pustulata TaxID=136370 RepID=A0A1W5D0L7_9LECA|nr:PQ-loop repeat [Lasallia pustulata]